VSSSFERLTGTYLLGLEPMLVFELEGGLAAAPVGVPPEFAARVVPAADGFRLEGGQLDGAPVVFADGAPCPGGTLGGVLEFTRAPEGFRVPGGRGLAVPTLDLPPDEEATYRTLLGTLASPRYSTSISL
jgi:hypothetical protein